MTDKEVMQMALDVLANNRYAPSIKETTEALRAALAQPEPKPVAWLKKDRSSIEVSIMSAEYMKNAGFEPLYTAPPQREWVGLTDEDRMICEQSAKGNYFALCAAVEAKLKEKNT
jgi:hypothetical protein